MKKIALISGSSPEFLGGISLYKKNLIEYAKKNKLNLDFTWIYAGLKNQRIILNGIKTIEIKSCKFPFLKDLDFSRKVKKILEQENFEIINSHANWGYFLKKYKKKENQKIIHTYHGVTFPYMKIQYSRFGILKYLFYPLLLHSYFIEKPAIKKADKIICVSEKVKSGLEKLYKKRRRAEIIRTGVNTKEFRKVSRELARKRLNLEKNKIYGLYSGRGGYWNKGLDRAISLGKEIYEKDKNFRLLVIGAEKKNCDKYLQEKFVLHRGVVDRERLKDYYSACDLFFCLSRYEGGAPTLANSEAMASGCFIVFSKDSQQEIIQNEREGLIIDSFGKESAEKILRILKDEKKLREIKKDAKKKIKEFDLESWGKKYFEVLLK